MILGFTGTRKGLREGQLISLERLMKFYRENGYDTLVHGGAIGADTDAHNLGRKLQYKIEVRPGPYTKVHLLNGGFFLYPRKPYIERDKDIVNQCDILFGCTATEYEEMRSGTWTTLRYARKTEKELKIILPDGYVI